MALGARCEWTWPTLGFSLPATEESLPKALWKTIPNASWGEGRAVPEKGSQAAVSPAPSAHHGAAWAGPLPGGAGGRGAEQGPWCLALCPYCSSCCHRCPDTAVPMSAPLLSLLLLQQLWSRTDCWVVVVLPNFNHTHFLLRKDVILIRKAYSINWCNYASDTIAFFTVNPRRLPWGVSYLWG